MRKPILGPVLADLDAVGVDGQEAILATAFYSTRRLEELKPQAERIDLLVRLDLRSPLDWIAGAIAPDGLLEFVRRQEARAAAVRVFHSPMAHAKAYVGQKGFLIGSANLTVRGFGGLANEILWFEDDARALRRMKAFMGEYRRGLKQVTTEQLETYVRKYATEVREASKSRRNWRDAENALPRGVVLRPQRLGEYQDFVEWLQRKGGTAATLIRSRALGEGQLSGHIKRNFFGVRQFLIAHAKTMRHLAEQDPNTYLLHRDAPTQAQLRAFVKQEATDEADLKVDTWRTYLPESSGGKPKSGGGTSGNLKRMLPLVARFLGDRLR